MDMSCILCSSRRKVLFGNAVCDVERHEGEQAEFYKEYEDRECFRIGVYQSTCNGKDHCDNCDDNDLCLVDSCV